ncbi:MAG TPA: zinc-binding alcohol dehydrogenase family protein [Nocardioidaceae bacterium]|nr:zinc-binding alcohol dehydrogenase family protein [Nocardioidaceae bacterium]
MRALVLRDPEQDPRLEDFGEPRATDGDVVVSVVAAALNPVDVKQATASGQSNLPRVVGNEAVVDCGGTLAYAERTVSPFGSVAEQAVVAADRLVDLPPQTDPSAAVAIGIPGIAAWMALQHVGQLRDGETVVVLGATGAAGTVAVQGAKLLGAGRVVAAGRRRDRLEPLTDIGADAIAVLDGADDTTRLREAADGDVDLIFDPLFGSPLAAAMKTLGPGGRSVTIGSSAGQTIDLAFGDLLGKSVLSHSNTLADPAAKKAAYREMVDHLTAGRLAVDTEDVTLDNVEDAWRRQREGPRRKLVVRPEGSSR